jgi:phosphatidylglycerol:prolipoprotein diacylglycerol transferase
MPDMSDASISFPILGEKFSLDFKNSFTLFGWDFHWYGIIIAVGFLLAVLYAMKKSKRFGLNEDNIIDLLLYAVPIAFICLRLFYVAFSDWNFEGSFWDNLWRIIKVWEGGLAIYGGVIGGVIGALIFSKVKKIRLGPILDVGALGLLIGQAVGRWGNFINREAFGYKTNVPWKMGLTNEYGTFYYHPTFLYESLWNVLGFILLHFYTKKRKFDGEIFLMYLGWYGLGRLYIEGLRTDSLMLGSLRVSQIVALLCIVVSVAILVYNRVSKHHDPDDLWVNRETALQDSDTGSTLDLIDEQETDEDLSEAWEALKNGSRLNEEDEPEPEPDDPDEKANQAVLPERKGDADLADESRTHD